MLRRFSSDFAIFSMLVDGLLVAFSLWLAINLRPYLGKLSSLIVDFEGPFNIPLMLYFVFAAMWVLILLLFSVYDGRRNIRVSDEMTSLILGSLLATVSLAGLLYLTFRDISRALFLVFVVLTTFNQIIVHLLYRWIFLIGAIKGVQTRRVLIIGAGIVGDEVAHHIEEHRDLGLGLTLVGFLDDDIEKLHSGEKVLGTLRNTRDVVLKQNVDDVVLALPRRAYRQANDLVAQLHDLPVKVWIVPDYFALALNQATIEELAGIPMIDLRAPALTDYQRMVKRAFDISISLLLLPFALPLMGLIALLIKLDGTGPILFNQQRAGENGRLFNMHKFRTMIPDADKMRHLIERVDENGKITQIKTERDPRVTRVGHILRKTSLDELPQIINVLKGEMSWVGPRPEMPHLVAQYEPWQRRRFAVPQGITGWWQVNGRSDKPMHLHTDEDLYYVQNYSLWLDIQILFKTLMVVFRRKGAY